MEDKIRKIVSCVIILWILCWWFYKSYMLMLGDDFDVDFYLGFSMFISVIGTAGYIACEELN